MRRTYQTSMLFKGLSVLDSLYLAARGVARGRFSFIRQHEGDPSLQAARELIQILGALPAHIGYIIIEHDLDVALRVVESVTVMHNGALFKEGTPDEIENDRE